MKKTVSIIAFVFASMLFFALFASAASTEIKSVSFSGANSSIPLSRATMKSVYKKSSSYNYYSSSGIPQSVTVKTADGKAYKFSSEKKTVKIGDYELSVKASVSKSVFESAVKKKASTVPVTVKCTLKKTSVDNTTDALMSIIGGNKTVKTFKLSKKLVSRYIKSVEPLSGFPKKIYSGVDFYNLEGSSFRVTYYDNAEKTIYTAEVDNEKTGEIDFELNELPLNVSLSDRELVFRYLDSPKASKAVTVLPNPLKSVKIIDYDAGINGLERITYRLEKKDGKSVDKSFECESFTTSSKPVPDMIIGAWNGYNIWLKSSDSSKNISTDKEKMVICIKVAGLSTSKSVKIPQKEEENSEPSTAFTVMSRFLEVLTKFMQTVFGSYIGSNSANAI